MCALNQIDSRPNAMLMQHFREEIRLDALEELCDIAATIRGNWTVRNLPE